MTTDDDVKTEAFAGMEKFHAMMDDFMESFGPSEHPKPPPGHIVYFVGAETGPVKIGFTQQPMAERLKCLQTGSPTRLSVLASRNCTRINERAYHKRFATYRLHGEWFERSPEIEAEIARLNGPSS